MNYIIRNRLGSNEIIIKFKDMVVINYRNDLQFLALAYDKICQWNNKIILTSHKSLIVERAESILNLLVLPKHFKYETKKEKIALRYTANSKSIIKGQGKLYIHDNVLMAFNNIHLLDDAIYNDILSNIELLNIARN